MKTFKRFFCICISVLTMTFLCILSFAGNEKQYRITNPYENVNWETVHTYKTALHTHTNASDGEQTMRESVERHALSGFDIIAISDHGTVNMTLETGSENKILHSLLKAIGRTEGNLEGIGKEGTFSDSVKYNYCTDVNGDDFVKLDNGKNILRIPFAIENNAVSVNAHVNSWFADYSDNSLTTYEDAVRGVSKAGGVCVINHPGEYTKARGELRSENAYDITNPSYAYYINKYANLIDRYPACIGIDINSKGDMRTRFDRILWDELLGRFSAKGRNVYAICSSDAHQTDIIDTGYVLALMNNQTSSDLRKSLENGEFFGASHCLGNYDELFEIASAIKEFYGETELYKALIESAEKMCERVVMIENGKEKADEEINMNYSVLDDDGYCTAKTHPFVKSITVSGDTITINTDKALIVRWISDGKLVSTEKAGEASFCISDFSDRVGNYVRAEIFGEGGIIYTQAFLINAEEKNPQTGVIKGFYFNVGVFDFSFAVFNNWNEVIARFFANVF